MRSDLFVCDSCGKETELGLNVVGWLDVAEIVLATVKEQKRWQFCSGLCLAIFAGQYVPAKPQKPTLHPDIMEKIGQYL